jgi:hypothetical protein
MRDSSRRNDGLQDAFDAAMLVARTGLSQAATLAAALPQPVHQHPIADLHQFRATDDSMQPVRRDNDLVERVTREFERVARHDETLRDHLLLAGDSVQLEDDDNDTDDELIDKMAQNSLTAARLAYKVPCALAPAS